MAKVIAWWRGHELVLGNKDDAVARKQKAEARKNKK
jgi:hypothetical protein